MGIFRCFGMSFFFVQYAGGWLLKDKYGYTKRKSDCFMETGRFLSTEMLQRLFSG